MKKLLVSLLLLLVSVSAYPIAEVWFKWANGNKNDVWYYNYQTSWLTITDDNSEVPQYLRPLNNEWMFWDFSRFESNAHSMEPYFIDLENIIKKQGYTCERFFKFVQQDKHSSCYYVGLYVSKSYLIDWSYAPFRN